MQHSAKFKLDYVISQTQRRVNVILVCSMGGVMDQLTYNI